MTAAEVSECGDEKVCVIVSTRHEMASAKVNPFKLAKPGRELFLYVLECAGKDITARLAVAMDVESLYAFWQSGWKV